MSFHSDYLRETGLLQAYQNLLKHLMNNLPKKENALEDASKFFSNFEKKYKPSASIKSSLIVDDTPPVKKERKKITLETKSRVFPSAAVITPKIFERQERTRPLIGNYKAEPIQYLFNDIFDGKTIQLQGTYEDQKVNEKDETSQFKLKDSQVLNDFERKNSNESKVSLKSASSKRSEMSKVSKKSKKSRDSEKSDRKSNRKKSSDSDKKDRSKNSGSDSEKSGSSKS